jgi:lipoyl(octanoyl) transferase
VLTVEMKERRNIRALWLGRRPYGPVLELQERLHEARRHGAIGDTLLLLEHAPVITEGRGADAAHLLGSPELLKELGVEMFSTARGGDVTLHAPGQLIAYPILSLAPDRQDVRRYVRDLTEIMRRLCAEHGVSAGALDAYIGLWADAEQPQHWDQLTASTPVKLGAIGVKISRWVTMHGFALNLTTDLSLFRLIVPCGIREHGVASVAQLSGAEPDVRHAAERALTAFSEVFDADVEPLEDLTAQSEDALLRCVLTRPKSS